MYAYNLGEKLSLRTAAWRIEKKFGGNIMIKPMEIYL
jgi:hypothetical protein